MIEWGKKRAAKSDSFGGYEEDPLSNVAEWNQNHIYRVEAYVDEWKHLKPDVPEYPEQVCEYCCDYFTPSIAGGQKYCSKPADCAEIMTLWTRKQYRLKLKKAATKEKITSG